MLLSAGGSAAGQAPLRPTQRTEALDLARFEAQQRPVPIPRLSKAQRRGLRVGAQLGIFAGLGIAWMVAAPEEGENCANFECIGRAAAFPIVLGAGMLGGMITGGAVGLVIGSMLDDEGDPRSTVGLSVRMRVR